MDYFPLFGPRLEYPLKRIEIHTPLPHREKKMPEILKISTENRAYRGRKQSVYSIRAIIHLNYIKINETKLSISVFFVRTPSLGASGGPLRVPKERLRYRRNVLDKTKFRMLSARLSNDLRI